MDEDKPLIDVLTDKAKCRNSNWLRCRLLGIIFIIAMLNCIGMNIYSYSTREWLRSKIKRELFPNETVPVDKICGNKSDNTSDKYDKIQEVTATWNIYMAAGSKFASLISAFIFTTYTDFLGRKYLLIIATFGMCFNSGVVAAIIYFDAHPICFVVMEIFHGFVGTHIGFEAATYSYISDLTVPGYQRSTAMFLFEASSRSGKALGAFSAGFFIQRSGYFYPTLTSAALQLALLIVVCFAITESLKKDKRSLRPLCLTVFKRPFAFYVSNEFRSVRCAFLLLLVAFAFADTIVTNRKSTETLYQMGPPFCWSSIKIGLFATAVSLGENVIGWGFLKFAQRFFTDIKIAIIGSLTNAGSLIVEGLASTSFVLYLSTVPAMLNHLTPPLIRSTMSAMTSENQQGALFASIILVQSLSSLLSGVTDNSVYAATLKFFNGFIFIVLSSFCGMTIVLLIVYTCITKGRNVAVYRTVE